MDSGQCRGFASLKNIDENGSTCAAMCRPIARMRTAAIPPAGADHETSDAYSGVIADLCDCHRVVICKDALQWILQRRKKGGAERPWRGVGYFRTRNALIRACASLCGRIDPAALAILMALPDHIGGAA